MSIFEFFKEKYNRHLQFPTIPVVEKGIAFQMEVCILHGQRFAQALTLDTFICRAHSDVPTRVYCWYPFNWQSDF